MSIEEKAGSHNTDPGGHKDESKTFDAAYVEGIRAEAAKHRVQAKEAAAKATAIEAELNELRRKLDTIDLDEVKTLREEKAEAERKKKDAEKAQLLKAGEYEKLTAQIKEEAEAKMNELSKTYEQRIADAEKAKAEAAAVLEKHMSETKAAKISAKIMSEASTADAINPEDIELRLKDKLGIAEIDGKNEIVVVDETGTPVRDASGKVKRVSDAVAEMRQNPKTAHLFKGTASGAGSGTKPNPTGGDTNPWKKESFNLTQQGLMYRADKAKAIKMAAEAGVKLT